MIKLSLLVSSVCALSLLSACSEEELETPEKAQQAQIKQATESVEKLLTEQKGQLDQSIEKINQSLKQLSTIYEKDYKVDENEIQGLAQQFEKLARQAGQGTKILESTTKVLGDAIQKGFEEGYNQTPKQ